MKKIIIFIFVILPLNVWAYSSYIIPGGDTLGIKINSDGIMIIGFYKVNNKYNQGDLLIGDYITKINGIYVSDTKQMLEIIDNLSSKDKLDITVKRDNKEINTSIDLIIEDNKYKTGLYVKDSIIGCGTLSYIDPTTGIYGALGHEIIESNTGNIVNIASGLIFENNITGIEKSYPSQAGSKISDFNYDNIFGDIKKNTITGVYGNYLGTLEDKDLMEIGNPKIGKAYIRTVISDKKIENFPVDILKINDTSEIKNILLKIDSKELIDKTGGIVQGMSGSPIIQNNKIVGVLTHVIVDNPISGYGVFITNMLKNGEK